VKRVFACLTLLVTAAVLAAGSASAAGSGPYGAKLTGPPNAKNGSTVVYEITLTNRTRWRAVFDGNIGGNDAATVNGPLVFNHGGYLVRSNVPVVGLGLASGKDWEVLVLPYKTKTLRFTVKIMTSDTDFFFATALGVGDQWEYADSIDTSVYR